jgi:hypothetical protein
MPDLIPVERPARTDPSRPGWCVWNVPRSPCCGVKRVHVFPASCLEIQCECGAFLETPRLFKMFPRATEQHLLSSGMGDSEPPGDAGDRTPLDNEETPGLDNLLGTEDR